MREPHKKINRLQNEHVTKKKQRLLEDNCSDFLIKATGTGSGGANDDDDDESDSAYDNVVINESERFAVGCADAQGECDSSPSPARRVRLLCCVTRAPALSLFSLRVCRERTVRCVCAFC